MKMKNNVRLRQRHRARYSQSIMAALGFFVLSSGVIFGGGASLIMVETRPIGASPVNQPEAETEALTQEPSPTITPPPLLSKPAPTPKPEWQIVNSTKIPTAPVSASAGLVLDDKTGHILAAKNSDAALPMASITKLMTAWVALDSAKMDKEIKISSKAAATPPTHMPLAKGEVLTVRDLLYMTLLTSANDAAQALADGLGGEEKFVAKMNQKAQDLGLTKTKFANPTGFDALGHKSSAQDLANLAHHLFIEHPELLDMLQQPSVVIKENKKHRAFDVVNFHQLVESYPGYLGGKPGYTGNAGNCLLTLAQRGDKRVIAVVLNSPDPAGESAKLLDMGFK